MIIDWTNFTPLSALAGGVLIGLSAALLFLSTGKIAGISGILGGLLGGQKDFLWRLLFLAGLFVAPLVWSWFSTQRPVPVELRITDVSGWVVLSLAGLLVGFGTRLANGCTSGHGVCGLARLSTRSAVAVLTFMSTGVLTAFAAHQLGGG